MEWRADFKLFIRQVYDIKCSSLCLSEEGTEISADFELICYQHIIVDSGIVDAYTRHR